MMSELLNLKRRDILKRIGMGALVLTSGMTGRGNADQTQVVEQVDVEKPEEQKAVATLKYLYDLDKIVPINQGGSSAAQNKALKKRAIIDLSTDQIKSYSLSLKLGFPKKDTPGVVTPQDVKKGIDSLMQNAQTFVSKYLGNKDGNFTPDKQTEWKKALNENPGLQIMKDMWINLSE